MNKMLQNLYEENFFFLANGSLIRGMMELDAALQNLDDTTYAHHVNSDKNDFASWIRDAIGDSELAAKLLPGMAKKDLQIAVLRRIVELLQG
jgi:hypothetical protein